MITAALLAIALLQQHATLTCPITGEAADAAVGGKAEFGGAEVTFCCPMCFSEFARDPSGALKSAASKGQVAAVYLFDPIDGIRLNTAQAKAFSVYDGIEFPFQSADEKKTFDADPKKYGDIPAKESLFCAVEKKDLGSYDKAGAYADYNGVRYYFCCDDCLSEFTASPAKYAPNAAKYVSNTKAMSVK